MALVNCPDCNKEISNKINACIHCGCPLDSQDDLIEKNDDDTQLEVGLIDEIGNMHAFVYKILTTDGYFVLTDRDTQILDLNDDSKVTNELEIGTLVYFKNDFSNDRLKTIYYSEDLPDWLDEKPSFENKKSILRTSNPKNKSNNLDIDDESKDERVTKKYLWYLVVLLIAASYWIAKGTPHPSLFFAGSAAKEACLDLANKNKGEMFFINNNKITANDTWLKDGKRVVQLIQKDEGNGMNQIMCIYGNGMVQIPSLFEQRRWQ